MKKKSDIILIFVTVVLVCVLIGGFIYDRNDALLDRTNYFAIRADDNLKLVQMNKVGFLYMRASYEAKIQILNGAADQYIIRIASVYGGQGQMFDYNHYKKYETDALNGVTIKPNPRQDSFIWVLGVPLSPNTSENIVYIVTIEGDGDAFIYLYYSRR